MMPRRTQFRFSYVAGKSPPCFQIRGRPTTVESNELEEIIYPLVDFNLHDRWICMLHIENVR